MQNWESLIAERSRPAERMAESIAKEADREIRRQKRKRCLAIARYYDEEVRDSIGYMSRCGGGYDAYVNAHIDKIKNRLNKWLELADKFKE